MNKKSQDQRKHLLKFSVLKNKIFLFCHYRSQGVLFFFILMFFNFLTKANNVNITNVNIQNINTSAGINNPLNYNEIKFNLSWENSWRDTASGNWDAVWVFAKFRKLPGGQWQHASLNDIGHTVPAGGAITVGLLNTQNPFNSTSNPGKGVFIYRDSDGYGNINLSNITLRWNFGVDNLTDTSIVELKLFGIEMVYVPTGGFYVGDGSTIIQGNYGSGITTNPYFVASESSITLGGPNINNLGVGSGAFFPDDFNTTITQTLPSAFPKGFNSFYCMKYEISQGQYVDFLNTLTFIQQQNRTTASPTSSIGTKALISSGNSYRNGVIISYPGSSPAIPARYACNLDSNQVFNDSTDGSWIACNWLNWADVSAYLDWAALRPMSDLEFEKACRGDALPFPNEKPWGTTEYTAAVQITNNGKNNETTLPANSNANFGNLAGVPGPVRVGAFADTGSTRVLSGASRLGIMELAGNLWERVVTTGNPTGRNFNGLHGNGSLDATGLSDVLNWPGASASGAGGRGGAWFTFDFMGRTSDRFGASAPDPSRDRSYGGRGVRGVQ